MIKTWNERCEEHPDHQTGMVSHSMIQMRMQEEIDELRAALAQPDPIISPKIKVDKTQSERKPLTQEELKVMWAEYAPNIGGIFEFARAIEKAHGIGEK